MWLSALPLVLSIGGADVQSLGGEQALDLSFDHRVVQDPADAGAEDSDDPYGVLAEDPEPEPAGDAEPTQADKDAEMEAALARRGNRFNQWHLQVAPGFAYLKSWGKQYSWKAVGPDLRIGAWKMGWRENFMIGGGPSIFTSFLKDDVSKDWITFATLNGDLIVGGGQHGKFAVFGHLTLGLGIARASDGQTGSKFTVPWGNSAIGVGGHYYLNDKLSLGALVDFNAGFAAWALDSFLTLNLHFGSPNKAKG